MLRKISWYLLYLVVNLGVQGGLGNLNEDVPLLFRFDLDLESLQDLKSFILGHLEAFGHDSRV